jgi:hypothetical protein
MTSLTKFKQRLRGELVKEELPLYTRSALEIDPVEHVIHGIEKVSMIDVAEVEIINFEDVIEEPVETSKLESMTKVEIDDYAAEHGIQLDRRQTKFNMITEFIQKIEEKN